MYTRKVSATSRPLRLSITAEAKERALAALKFRQEDARGKGPLLADEDLAKAVAPASSTWDALRLRLERAGAPNKADAPETLALVEVLLDQIREAFTIPTASSARPPMHTGRPPSIAPAGPALKFEISCPTTSEDYRVVIVGQLPGHGLFPAVFVNPLHRPRRWYPQSKPIQTGVAFMCLAHVGRPAELGQQQKRPFECEVRLYALRRPYTPPSPSSSSHAIWERGYDPVAVVTTEELEADVNKLGVFDMTKRTVTCRTPEIGNATFCASGRSSPFGSPAEWSGNSPVKIDWQGGDAFVEVVRLPPNQMIFGEPLKRSVVLQVAPAPSRAKPTGPKVISVMEPGLFRVRLYPLRRVFLDPLHELWINFT
jgi:hypothetical protein